MNKEANSKRLDEQNTTGQTNPADLSQGEPAKSVLLNCLRGYFAGTTVASFVEDETGNFYLNPISGDVLYIPKSDCSLI